MYVFPRKDSVVKRQISVSLFWPIFSGTKKCCEGRNLRKILQNLRTFAMIFALVMLVKNKQNFVMSVEFLELYVRTDLFTG